MMMLDSWRREKMSEKKNFCSSGSSSVTKKRALFLFFFFFLSWYSPSSNLDNLFKFATCSVSGNKLDFCKNKIWETFGKLFFLSLLFLPNQQSTVTGSARRREQKLRLVRCLSVGYVDLPSFLLCPSPELNSLLLLVWENRHHSSNARLFKGKKKDSF